MSGPRLKTRSSCPNFTDVSGSRQANLQRVLVIRIGRLGDTILATPVIEVLQRKLGADVSIDFVSSPGASELILSMDERVNQVFPIARRSIPWRLHPAKRELEKYSRAKPYDLVINLECGAECDDFYKFVHSHEFCGRPLIAPAHRSDRHCVDTEKTIYADLLGAARTEAAETSLKLKPEFVPALSKLDGDYIVINPGFSGLNKGGYRRHRAWPEKHWVRLIEMLGGEERITVLINGTEEEKQHFSSLLQVEGARSLFGSSLSELISALSHARCLVSVDTGTMHLSAALGTPVVALFGPSNPLLTGPYSTRGVHSTLASGVECQPCVGTAEQRECGFNRCMSELEPGQVLEAIRRLN